MGENEGKASISATGPSRLLELRQPGNRITASTEPPQGLSSPFPTRHNLHSEAKSS